MKKKVNLFGKGIPVLAIFVLGMALVSAALIPYFGKITGLVTVNQGLTWDGAKWDADLKFDFDTQTTTSLEEKTFTSDHYLENTANVDAEFSLVTTCLENCDEGIPQGINWWYEYDLDTGTNLGLGDEDRIYIRAEDVGVVDLDDLTSMSWEVYTALGYPPHVDIILADDIDGIVNIDSITAEMSVDHNNMGIVDIANNLPMKWVKTFELTSGDGHGIIVDSTIFWVTRLGSGTVNAPYGTLAELKVGTVQNLGNNQITISGATKVLGFEIEVDNWIANTKAKVRNIDISGNSCEVSGLKADDTLYFDFKVDFPKMLVPAEYTITTKVMPTA